MSTLRSNVQVQVGNMDLDENCRDYLAFYDGYVDVYSTEPDVQLCGNQGFTYISTGYQMTIYFFTDNTHSQNRGFTLLYMDGKKQAGKPIATNMGDDNNSDVIIISVVASLVVILIIILVTVGIYKHRRRGAPMMHQNQPSSGVANSGNQEPSSPCILDPSTRQHPSAKLRRSDSR